MSAYLAAKLSLALLAVKRASSQEDETITGVSQTSFPAVTEPIPFIETLLVGPFKVWHVGGFVGCGIATILIAICCMIELRVPKTKEEIEANYEKRQAAHQYIDKLGKMEFTGLKLKSQALLQRERQQKKTQKEQDKQKKLEQKKVDKKPAINRPPSSSFPIGFPMMGGANSMMGGANSMMGGANSMMGGANSMMGGANNMMNNMMAFNPAMLMGNPAMFGSMPNLNQPADVEKATPGSHAMLTESQSLSNLQTIAEVVETPNSSETTNEFPDKTQPASASGKFSSVVKGMMKKGDSNESGNGDKQQTEKDNSTSTVKAAVKKKWNKK